jgi:hypothetical protein
MFLTLHCSRSIQMSLSVLLLGVGVATVTDLQLNAVGSILSLLAIITTCIAQIVSFQQQLLFLFHKMKFKVLILFFTLVGCTHRQLHFHVISLVVYYKATNLACIHISTRDRICHHFTLVLLKARRLL